MAKKAVVEDYDDDEVVEDEESGEEAVERTPRKARSEVLADAVGSIDGAYNELMSAVQSGDEDAQLEALKILGREAGRIRRVIRTTQKGLAAEDADSAALFNQLLPA